MTARRSTPWALFFGLWILYGICIDKRDLQFYEIHHTGARAMAEHHRFWYRESAPDHGVGGDRFDYEGRVYANKQPGSIFAGAIVYGALRPFGLDYGRSYFRTAAVVTLFTSALLTAITAVLLYRLVLEWTASGGWALLAALGFGLGTLAFPYTGTLHHDAMAAAFLFAGFYWMEKRPVLSGVFLGLAVATSMLAWFAAGLLALFFLGWRAGSLRARALFVAGAIVGAMPLIVYNTVSFGSPFSQGVTVSGHWVYLPAGLDARTLPLLLDYLRMLVLYTPIAVVGLLGATLLPAARRRERYLVLTLAAVQLAFVVVVHADGACQYGPRMLLPVFPFAALGIAGFARWRADGDRKWIAAAVAAVAAVSFALNVPGALYGTAFCSDKYAVREYLVAARHGYGFSLPLLGPLGAPHGAASKEADRRYAEFLLEEARVTVALGHLEQAREELEIAAALAPDFALVHLDTASLAYQQGDLLGTVAALERAVALDPDNAGLRADLESMRRLVGKR